MPRRRLAHAALAVMLQALLALADDAGAAPSFAPPAIVSTGQVRSPVDVVAGDVNGDGENDLVVVGGASGEPVVVTLLSDGFGRFSRVPGPLVSFTPRWGALAEYGGTGSVDLVVADSSACLHIFLGTGTGSFTAAGAPPPVCVPDAASSGFVRAVGRALHGNSAKDVIVAYIDTLGGHALARFDATPGGFAAPTTVPTTIEAGTVITDLVLHDVDEVNGNDLIVHLTAADGTGTVRVFLNQGAGVLGAPDDYPSDARFSPAMALADVTGDGVVDVVTVSVEDGDGTGRITILPGDGAGGFEAATIMATGLGPRAVALADADRDGAVDVLIAAYDPAEPRWVLRVHPRKSGATLADTFDEPVQFEVGVTENGPIPHLRVGSFNRDGKADAVIVVDVGQGGTAIPETFPNSVAIFANITVVPGTRRLTVLRSGAGTVTSTPAGIDCGLTAADCRETYTTATPVVLTAAPRPDWVFTGFIGGGCSGSPCSLTVDADVTVVASFAHQNALDGAPNLDEIPPAGATASFITAGSAGFGSAFHLSYFAKSDPGYTASSVVQLNGVLMPSEVVGAALRGTVPYTALPAVRPATLPMGVLTGLPNGPFRISIADFPLDIVRACLTGTACTSEVTAVPAPANPATILQVTLTATNPVFHDFDTVTVDGVSRTFALGGTCINDGCTEATVDVRLADIQQAGTLMLASSNTQAPGVGTLTIRDPMQITTASPLPGGTIGTAYSRTISATGGSASRTWAIDNPPDGLSLNVSTGVLSGTPTATGAFQFTITVSDADFPLATASRAFTLVIAAAPSITSQSPLPPSTRDVAYPIFDLITSGGTEPFRWAVTAGALPAGMVVSAGGGRVRGTPTQAGIFVFTTRLTDAAGATASKQFSLTIAPPPVITTGTPLPEGTRNVAYPDLTLTASGGTPPFTWTRTAGSLPTGVTLSSQGVLGGTPTQAGTFDFTARATDAVGATATKALTLTIEIVNPPPDTTPPALTVTSPASPHETTSGVLAANGTASDNVAVTAVTWANDRGGSGTAGGTANWSATGIPLQPGKNRIRFTARDAADNRTSRNVFVYFFTDTLTSSATPIRAVHFLDIASAIDDMRRRHSLAGSVEWSVVPPAAGGTVLAAHLNDLRAALGALYDALGIPVGTRFARTPIAVGTRINAAQLEQLREAIRLLP